MEGLRNMFGATGAIVFAIAGPITYILNVVDTWQGNASAWLKIVINLTLDAVLAAIWPITWAIWIITEATGGESPLSSVLGL